MSVLIRRITLAASMAALVGGTLALPASSKTGPVASREQVQEEEEALGPVGQEEEEVQAAVSAADATSRAGDPPERRRTRRTPPAVGVSAIGVADQSGPGRGHGTTGQVTIDATPRRAGARRSPCRAAIRVASTVPGERRRRTPARPPRTSRSARRRDPTVDDDHDGRDRHQQRHHAAQRRVSAPSVESAVARASSASRPAASRRTESPSTSPAPVDTAVGSRATSRSLWASRPGPPPCRPDRRPALRGDRHASPNPLGDGDRDPRSSSRATDSASVSGTSPSPTVTGVSVQPDTVTVGSPIDRHGDARLRGALGRGAGRPLLRPAPACHRARSTGDRAGRTS